MIGKVGIVPGRFGVTNEIQGFHAGIQKKKKRVVAECPQKFKDRSWADSRPTIP
jgi:hypothetical protein